MPRSINRRSGLKHMAGAALVAGLPAGLSTPLWAAEPTRASLNDLAQRKGRRFGSAIAAGNVTGGTVENSDYASIIKSECGVIVAENEMKWQTLRPVPDIYKFERADRIAAWTKASGLALRGHTLVWHRPRWMPDWVNNYDYGANPASAAEALITDHVRKMIGRYSDQVKSWDVVNEAVNDAVNGLEETSFSRAIGSVEQSIDIAFHAARQAAPDAQLVYNDYMSWEPSYAGHRAMVLRLLEGFKKRGTPVDALGVQSHIEMFSLDSTTGLGPYAEREWRAFMDEVTAMGYRVLITEFDVKDKAAPGDISIRDAKVADYSRRYLDVMLSYPQLGDILAWGMVDCYSWLQGFAPRIDGMEVRGSPYGSDYHPKPLRDAIATSLLGASQAL